MQNVSEMKIHIDMMIGCITKMADCTNKYLK